MAESPASAITSKGQVTIPKQLRQLLGLRGKTTEPQNCRALASSKQRTSRCLSILTRLSC
jgi:hypothetical protein